MSFRINRVYTRSGDTGETGLVGGARVLKTHPRVLAYGSLDELNSALGLVKEEAKTLAAPGPVLVGIIEYLQQELFDIGSELATPASAHYAGMWTVGELHVRRLEQLCDAYGAELPELPSFLLPGGSRTAAALHLARCEARRAEREILAFEESQPGAVSPMLRAYVNRLSDLLFVLARWALHAEGKETPLWVQEKDRALPTEALERIKAAAAGKASSDERG